MSEEGEAVESAELPEDAGKVDLTGLPDAERQVIGRRFGVLTKTVKELREQQAEMARANKALFDKVSGMESRGAETERQQILDGIREASEDGDHEKVATLTDRLTRLNSNSKDTSSGAEDPPKKSAEPDKDGAESPDIVSEQLSTEDEARLVTWTNETDSEGNPVRPWLQEGHPKYKRAMAAAQAVMADDSLTITQKMAEVDSIMGMQKTAPPANQVLSPGTAPRQGKTGPKATPEQRAVAEAMGVDLKDYMGIVAGSETYPDGSMVKILELED